jgi:hypothetical protein
VRDVQGPEGNHRGFNEACVKQFSTFLLCLGIFLFFWVPSGRAQGQKPDQPTAPPPTNPLDLKIQAPPALPPKAPDVRQPGETGWSISVDSFFPSQHPVFNKGRDAAFDTASRTVLQGTPNYAAGAEIGVALGLHNALRLSYFSTRAAGDLIAPSDLRIWNQSYSAGTYVSTSYRLQNAKLSFDFLTWPYPVESRRFRLKTLWQLQYTTIQTNFNAPLLPLFDSTGAPLVDSSGNPISYNGIGTHWFVSPEVGIGVAYFSGRHFRFEANAAGFAIPHRNTVWDMDATANIRSGHLEFRLGGKAFHFKTSTREEFYDRGTFFGPFVGIRWYSD